MNHKKVQAIVDWQARRHVNDLRSFLGWANYYKKFNSRVLQRATTLIIFLNNDMIWVWQERCREAFQNLEEAIASEPMLTDASDKAIGGVLVQEGHLVVFESQKLNDAEKRYLTHKKEMVVVVHCLQVWGVSLSYSICGEN